MPVQTPAPASRPAVGSTALLLAVFVLLPFRGALGGCGCDHPLPAWTPVVPPFASPGHVIRIHAIDGESFVLGEEYTVYFKGHAVAATTVAEESDFLDVAVPEAVSPGPVELEVEGAGQYASYPSQFFTALAAPAVVPGVEGTFTQKRFPAAVAEDGTLLIPFDMSAVVDATQFALKIGNVPLEFGPDDVVFYNADAVDLTLFTLYVDEPDRQWGSYYGWQVGDDTGALFGEVFEKKVKGASRPDRESNMLTYWRHEFQTYADAHAPGGSHEVVDGLHPDGTVHIDHDHLVLALSATKRNPSDPLNPSELKPLNPGKLGVEVVLMAVKSAGPISADEMQSLLDAQSDLQPLDRP